MDDENLAAYRERHREPVGALEEETGQLKEQERQLRRQTTGPDSLINQPSSDLTISKTMRTGWATGNFWFFSALNTFKGLYSLFIQHIQPRYGTPVEALDDFEQIVASYWTAAAPDTGGVGGDGMSEFAQGKIKERKRGIWRK